MYLVILLTTVIDDGNGFLGQEYFAHLLLLHEYEQSMLPLHNIQELLVLVLLGIVALKG